MVRLSFGCRDGVAGGSLFVPLFQAPGREGWLIDGERADCVFRRPDTEGEPTDAVALPCGGRVGGDGARGFCYGLHGTGLHIAWFPGRGAVNGCLATTMFARRARCSPDPHCTEFYANILRQDGIL